MRSVRDHCPFFALDGVGERGYIEEVAIPNMLYGESVAAGDLVGWSDGKLVLACGAVGTNVAAIGFVPNKPPKSTGYVYEDGDIGDVVILGEIPKSWSGLSPGAVVYLSLTVPGNIQQAEPTGAGNLSQIVGYAASSDRVIFQPDSLVGTVL